MSQGDTMKKKLILTLLVWSFVFFVIHSGLIYPESVKKDLILKSAGEIVNSSKLCVLISRGLDGFPNARTMDPFPPDKNWVIWMGTNSQSRKVKEILKNNKISIFYESPNGDGYVTLKGSGFINNEQENKVKYFKDGWKEFYPGDRKNFTLIKFIPELLEIVSYKKGLLGEKTTWTAPSIKLKENSSEL